MSTITKEIPYGGGSTLRLPRTTPKQFMGMTCTLRRVNETEVRRLREEPEQVFTFLYGEGLPFELTFQEVEKLDRETSTRY